MFAGAFGAEEFVGQGSRHFLSAFQAFFIGC
jgi:hypothetical protein